VSVCARSNRSVGDPALDMRAFFHILEKLKVSNLIDASHSRLSLDCPSSICADG
jgi:hypothetical protein